MIIEEEKYVGLISHDFKKNKNIPYLLLRFVTLEAALAKLLLLKNEILLLS